MSDTENILRRVLDKIIEELQYKHADISIKALSTGGANYTSALFSIDITAPEHDNLKLFAKVASISEALRKLMKIDFIFKTEQDVYTDLAKVYEKIQDKHNVSPDQRCVFPKFYGGESAKGEETVVMEDLRTKGFGPYSRFKSVDWELAASAMECLARFHAVSFAYQTEDPVNFAKHVEQFKFEKIDDLDDPNAKATWNKMVDGALQVVKEEHKERLAKLLNEEPGQEMFYKFRSPLSTPVLCHGDYRVSNMLFRQLGDRLDPIVVDFQTVHSGSPVSDLLYFEFMGTDQEFRRENHQRLLDHYFNELTVALDRLGVDVNEVYPRETFDSELKTMLSLTLFVAMTILPMVLVEAEQAPHLSDIQEIKDLALTPGQLFAERYSGLVSDCVAWGAI